MANGKIRFGKQSGGQLALVFPDGVSDTEVVLPESGELATKDYVDINSFNPTPTIATGTATFNSTTNNINLTGIGIGVEIGDVIQISGSTNNNSEFTVEVITNTNNVIVNQAHAGKSLTYLNGKRTKTLNSETSNVTVKLLAKYYNAPPSLGRDYVSMVGSRSVNITYTNNTGREMIVSAELGEANTQGIQVLVDGKRVNYNINTQSCIRAGIQFKVPSESSYLVNNNGIGVNVVGAWYEIR